MTKLKLCPFCGSNNLELADPKDNPGHESWVHCKSCHASSGMKSTMTLAAEEWNKRDVLLIIDDPQVLPVDDVADLVENLIDQNKKLQAVVSASAWCIIDLSYNLKEANKEYIEGKLANGAFQRVLNRHTALHTAFYDAGYTEKHQFFDFPVKPTVKKDEQKTVFSTRQIVYEFMKMCFTDKMIIAGKINIAMPTELPMHEACVIFVRNVREQNKIQEFTQEVNHLIIKNKKG